MNLAKATRLILQQAMHRDHLDAHAIAAIDIAKQDRKMMAGELLAGRAALIAPRIYGMMEPSGYLMSEHFGTVNLIPPPHLVACALSRQHGWQLGLPTEFAQFMLGLGERPERLPVIPYDQPEPRQYGKCGLMLLAEGSRVIDLSPIGQSLARGLPIDVNEAKLREIGITARRHAIGNLMVKKREWLMHDINSGLLTGRETIVLDAMLESDEGAIRTAPTDFVPPTGVPTIIHGWSIFKTGSVFKPGAGNEVLTAEAVSGHPHLPDGERMSKSSLLVWIDEDLGWARTQSRIYKLGRKAPC